MVIPAFTPVLLVLVALDMRAAAFGGLTTPPIAFRPAYSRSVGECTTPCPPRSPYSAKPLMRPSLKRRSNIMDAGEELEQQDVIPGMPETIAVQPVKDIGRHGGASRIEYAQQLGWPPNKPKGDGDEGEAGNTTFRAGIHSIFPTGRFFDRANRECADSLPRYSLEPETAETATVAAPDGVEPRDHAESIAKEIAQKIAQGRGGSYSSAPDLTTAWNFRAAALKSVTEHVEIRERRAEAIRPARGPAGIDATRVPNLWLAVGHASSVKAGEVKKVEVDGVPIALWRSATGVLSAVSDVCIHRGASLARGSIFSDRLVCPYHGFEFEADGRLAHMPGTVPPAGNPPSVAGKTATGRKRSTASPSCGARKAPTYPVKELGGWIYIFPDETRPGSVEQHRDPVIIPEALSPNFRAVEGSMEIRGGVGACVENMLDLLHISFVHSFGNLQEPTPFEVSYEQGYDDPGTDALMTSKVTFRYRSGSKSFSKVVGKSTEVVVKNEFHLPYRAVIRVHFGENSLKTIEATAVPTACGETTLHWKLYRNFALSHPLDEGPINKIGDFLFRKMMNLTLTEDKEIVESIYPEYQRGFMNARYDNQMLQYRKAIANFQAIASDRANSQLESSLQVELLNRIARSQRGLAADQRDRAAIIDLIQRLESVQTASVATPTPGAAAEIDTMVAEESVEGEWHLEYISSTEEGVGGWDFASVADLEKTKRTAALKEAGGEARLIDWNETGRPLWADTTKSVQIINTKARTLSNLAVYKGWSGFTTTVQLDAFIEPLKDQANRLMVGFHKAIVDVGGMKVTFPHLQRFSPTGWMETTYVKQGIRIARGNKGSIFVLTRKPVSSSTRSLFDDDNPSSK